MRGCRLKHIRNKTFSEAIQAFENKKSKQSRKRVSLHPEIAEAMIYRQQHSKILFDEICVNGKTYPLLHMFAINAPQTAYEKLLDFLH